MQNTANLNLKKPEGTDIVNIEDLNGNMDILDGEIVKKVDKVTGKQLSTEDYTTDEKTKLAGVAANANNYTHPSSHPPSIITQDANNRFATDAEKTAWNAKASTAVATTSANGLMSSADKTKLDGVAANANNYTHPTNHPPSIITQDTSNRFVTDTEKATWNAKASTAVATTSASGLMSSADKTKLDGVAANANNYTHPSSHPPSIITQDTSNRFVTDDEKTAWNGKETPEGAQAKADEVQDNLAAHSDATNPHASTYTATANRIILRDANGRAQVAAPSAAADIARKDTVDTVQTNLNTHAADRLNHIPYAIATGSANTYAVTLSPAPTAYADGMALCVKINVASTGASTVNVNGLGAKTILDSLGNAITAGGLKAATPYTLRYNGTNFIVQGKGGGGNAAAADLLSGKTATVDGGPIVGTMPVIAGDIAGTAVNGTMIPGRIYIQPPGNIYWPSTGFFVYYDDSDFNPANFLATKNIFGLQGAIPVLGNEEYWSWRRATVVAPSQESRVNLAIPIGAYLTENAAQGAGLTGIFAEDPDFIAANFRADKNVFGLQGSMPIIQPNSPPLNVSYWLPNTYGNQYAKVHFLTPAGYCGDGGVWLSQDMPDLLPGNFLATKNIFGIQGAIPERPYPQDATAIAYSGLGTLWLGMPTGAYLSTGGFGVGTACVQAYDPNFISDNIISGTSIFGLAGTRTAKRTAQGAIPSSSFVMAISNDYYNAPYYNFSISGLSFRAGVVIIHIQFKSGSSAGISSFYSVVVASIDGTVYSCGPYGDGRSYNVVKTDSRDTNRTTWLAQPVQSSVGSFTVPIAFVHENGWGGAGGTVEVTHWYAIEA